MARIEEDETDIDSRESWSLSAEPHEARNLGVRDPMGSDVSRETHGRPLAKGVERSLEPSEALDLSVS
ncbi:hypothetical protein CRG98_024567 [Punica granatum]|uniref:Uncharacterized protein n=1 Tax=Punica granatum TaxID=22663 RepID=A0A2I0JFK2_PUNGR|nr:hypothetical protein CRG98_024567 [Punica granatum]